MGKNVLASMRGDFGVARKYAQVVQKKKRSGYPCGGFGACQA